MTLPILERRSVAPATQGGSPRPRMLRVEAVADLLDLPVKRVYCLVNEGLLPHARIGRSIRFDEQRLHDWLTAGGSTHIKEKDQ